MNILEWRTITLKALLLRSLPLCLKAWQKKKKKKKGTPIFVRIWNWKKKEQKHCTCSECLWVGFLVLSQYYYYNTGKAILIIILQEWYRSSQKHNPSQIYLPTELSLKSMGIWRLSNGGKASAKHKCSDSASRSLLQQNSYVNQWKFCLGGEIRNEPHFVCRDWKI